MTNYEASYEKLSHPCLQGKPHHGQYSMLIDVHNIRPSFMGTYNVGYCGNHLENLLSVFAGHLLSTNIPLF
jgi:hypothetical protein